MGARITTATALLFIALLGACGGGGTKLQIKAASDLDCPQEQILMTDSGGCNIVATGCGKKAKYFVRPHAPESTACCPPAGCDVERQGAVESE